MAGLVPGSVVDRFVVESTLGAGALAVVYLVRHQSLSTRHALKVLHHPPTGGDDLLWAGRLIHPNLVRVIDVVDVDGGRGLVAEWVPGAPLDLFLTRHAPTLDEADDLARGILAGVAAAHAAARVHGGLKPSNVLLDSRTEAPIPKVSNLGMVQALGVGHSPAHMAPEQIDLDRSVDPRTDVFALGAVLFELVAGHPAFASSSTADLAARRHARPPPIPDGLPAGMRAAITAALDPDPDRRPADAAVLLGIWSEGRPAPGPEVWTKAGRAAAAAPRGADDTVQPPPRPPQRRWWRWCRRCPWGRR